MMKNDGKTIGYTSEMIKAGTGELTNKFHDKRQIIAMAKIGKIVKDIYYDQFKWSVVKNIAFFMVGVKIAIECNGMTLMPPV
ncbi:hypothetical protein DMN91_004840 [Ooceraea biroi]|uniref:Uncharacterized protein n=1 Tax=Ooceraea biroi TaxID=2015173 RepID=A0A3L8DQM1_OOCBI|nr:hypothetical protein DMN91_004840 [Ooceraea biroi]